MALQIACDCPDCPNVEAWDEPEKIPFGWWLLEQRTEIEPEVQLVACSLLCVEQLARHEREARAVAEEQSA